MSTDEQARVALWADVALRGGPRGADYGSKATWLGSRTRGIPRDRKRWQTHEDFKTRENGCGCSL